MAPLSRRQFLVVTGLSASAARLQSGRSGLRSGFDRGSPTAYRFQKEVLGFALLSPPYAPRSAGRPVCISVPLLWHADIDGKHWLTIDKGTGTLQPGQKEIVNVKIDTSSLAIGNHKAKLIFSAEGDASSKSVEVAVTLAVTPPPL